MGLRKILFIVTSNALIAGVGLHLLSGYLFAIGRIPESCRGTVLRCVRDLFRQHWADDSWGPMLAALRAFQENPGGSIYKAAFFERPHWIKFQYPLPTLLPLWTLQRLGLDNSTIHRVLEVLSWTAVMATAALVVAIALKSARSGASRSLLVSIALVASFSFYPVLWAYQIGQIQVFGNLIFSIAFYCWLTNREVAAGVATGLLAMMKPQFLIVLAWGVLRRRWSFAWAGSICAAIGSLASLLVFGAAKYWEYFGVLGYISRHGESYYANQSLNGLLNRLLLNWSSVEVYSQVFPPYRPIIYVLTVLSSASLIFWALRVRSTLTPESRIMDFILIAVAATAASPIAWYHHYGILLPVLCWLLVQMSEQNEWSHRDGYRIVAAYLLVANDPRITNLAANVPVINLIQSSFFAGVLLLMTFLWMRIGVPNSSKQAVEIQSRDSALIQPIIRGGAATAKSGELA